MAIGRAVERMTKASSLGLEAIEVVRLHEQVYQTLTRALMSGRIPPGRKLTSRKLAAELGTSDMPVRAALVRLQSLRALVALPNGSLILPRMRRGQFADLMAARVLCEGQAAELAASHATAADLRAIRQAGAALTQAALDQDIDDYLARNYEFKFHIYRACGSEALIFLIETLWLQAAPFLRQFAGKFEGALAGILEIDYHDELAAALAERNATLAGALMRRDIHEGAEYLLAHGDFDAEASS